MPAPTMTAAEAKDFDRFSVANAATVESSLQCSCEAYTDVFTYNRWKAQGFQVMKGEKAIRIPTIRTIKKENEEGEETTRSMKRTSYVFCRCQVQEIDPA